MPRPRLETPFSLSSVRSRHRRELHRSRGRGVTLRKRGLEVHVVGPEARPMETVLGQEVGDLVRKIHQEHGVAFHLDTHLI